MNPTTKQARQPRKPGGIGHYQMGITAVANSHGRGDIELLHKEPSDLFKILALDNSFTVGANVRQEL